MSAERNAPVVDPAGRTALRVFGLVGLVYIVVAAARPGTSGRHLAALFLTVAIGVTWAAWLLSRRLGWSIVGGASLALLSVAGGVLVVLSPVGIGVVGAAALAAGNFYDERTAIGVGGLGIGATAVAIVVDGHSAGVIGGTATGALAGLMIGVRMRQQQERLLHAAELELAEQRTHVAQERAQVLDERNRIAREVHDVLAHTLSALSVQMEALASVVEADATADVVAAVQRSRRLVVEGLDETRRAVRALRDEPVAVAEQVEALARESGAALTLTGDARPLSPAAGLAIVRIAQEALTNARKHAPGASVRVALEFGDAVTTLVVDNDAHTTTTESALGASGGGYGLRGMRERVELLGGSLAAGVRGGRWVVRAEVPS